MGRPLSEQPDVLRQFVLAGVDGVEDVDALRLEYEAQGYATMVRAAPSSGRRALYVSAAGESGYAPVLGMILVVGIVVSVFAAAAVPLLAWCPACEQGAAPSTPGARWADCGDGEDAASSAGGCVLRDGEVVVAKRGGEPLCLRKVVATTSGQRVQGVVRFVCEVVGAVS